MKSNCLTTILAVMALLTVGATQSHGLKPPMYFVLIDRFHNADPANDYKVNSSDPAVPGANPNAYQGGDLAGVIKKLDYLQAIGVRTIWLSPVMDNRDSDFFGGYGYHGYWIKDFFKVDEHLGSMAELKDLVRMAHDRQIAVVLDIVLNHCDWDAPIKQEHPDWFHNRGDIKNWDKPEEVEEGNLTGLPDFNQDVPTVYDYLKTIALFWARETDCDGFRFDAVKHIPHRFWKKYLADLRLELGPDFYFLGEVMNGDPSTAAAYLDDGFDGLFDFPLYYRLLETFREHGSLKKIGTILRADALYRDSRAMNPFLGNHDTERFYQSAMGMDAYKLALGLIYTLRGLPVLYYGEEAPLAQHSSFHSRGLMNFGGDRSLALYLRRLSDIKNQSPALSIGNQEVIVSEDSLLGLMRYLDQEEVFVFINNSTSPARQTITLPALIYADSTSPLQTLYGSGSLNFTGPGKADVTVAPMNIFMVQAKPEKKHEPKNTENLIEVEIVIPGVQTNWGENVFLTGSTDLLGNFNPARAYGPLTCPQYLTWLGKMKIPANQQIEIQPLVLDAGGKVIKSGNRSRITAHSAGDRLTINF